MVRCPNCGSTAQPKLQKEEEKELSCYTIEVARTYKCGCGHVFTEKEYRNGEYFNENQGLTNKTKYVIISIHQKKGAKKNGVRNRTGRNYGSTAWRTNPKGKVSRRSSYRH